MTATGYFFFPLFALTSESWAFVLGKASHPVQVVGAVSTSASFEAGGKTYSTLEVVGDFFFGGTKPGFEVNFLDSEGGSVDGYTALDSLLHSSAIEWIDAVLSVKPVSDWLATKIGTSKTESIESVLAAAKLLVEPQAPSSSYTVASLTGFLEQTPLEVTEELALEALKILAAQESPYCCVCSPACPPGCGSLRDSR